MQTFRGVIVLSMSSRVGYSLSDLPLNMAGRGTDINFRQKSKKSGGCFG